MSHIRPTQDEKAEDHGQPATTTTQHEFKLGDLVEIRGGEDPNDPDIYDHGRVESLNADGTVTVAWNHCGEKYDEAPADIQPKA